jgi:hypothetical protein
MTTTITSFPLSKHTGGGGSTPAFSSRLVYLQFTWEVSLPPSPVEFSHTTFTGFPAPRLLGRGCQSCLIWLACLFTVLWGIFPPPLCAQGSLPSLLCVFLLLLFIQFYSFFPWVGSVCPGGYADFTQGCQWEYCLPLSSPGGLFLSNW